MNPIIDPYVLEHARLRARLLCASAGFPLNDCEDACQDLLLDFWRRLSKYDCAQDFQVFVRWVMQNHVCKLIVGRVRRVTHEVLADDIPGGAEPDEGLGTLAQHDPTAGINTAIDVRRILAGLPVHLQTLAGLLAENSLKEVCTAMGKSRSSVYQMRLQLKDAFLEAGFRRGSRWRLAVPR